MKELVIDGVADRSFSAIQKNDPWLCKVVVTLNHPDDYDPITEWFRALSEDVMWEYDHRDNNMYTTGIRTQAFYFDDEEIAMIFKLKFG
jgi:hypothetical protein